MSLKQPTSVVEYSSDAVSWTDVSSYRMSFEITLRELKAGVSSFEATFDNKNGDLTGSSHFPRRTTEKGLAYYFRFRVNNQILFLGLAKEMVPAFDSHEGDKLSVRGLGLDEELLRRKLQAETIYQSTWKADDLLANVINTQMNPALSNVSFTSPSTAPTIIGTDFPIGISVRDIIVDVAEHIEASAGGPPWEAFVPSQVKPAPLQFFELNNSSRRHSVVLQGILPSSTNNIKSARLPRSIFELKNYLKFEANMEVVEGVLPDDANRDGFTESTNGWNATVGSLSFDTTTKVKGNGSVRITQNLTPPGMELQLNHSSIFGEYFDVEKKKASMLVFAYAIDPGLDNGDVAVAPRLTLRDSSANEIHLDLPIPDSKAFSTYSIPLLDVTLDSWQGSTSNFTWILDSVKFTDSYAGMRPPWDRTIWIDGLYFVASEGGVYLQQNSSSISKYGRHDAFFSNPNHPESLSTYGERMLSRNAWPLEKLECEILIDPATISTTIGASTFYGLLPGYGVEVDIPRWLVYKATGTPPNQGTHWRIVEVKYRLDRGGLVTSLVLAPASSETIDHSRFENRRYLRSTEALLGGVVD